ncbi:MAG: DUF1189 family protein [Elusimicrobiaceae bacterium]|nr:DUF1189 family protein [Elusimicrobiaceae bacterium]
MLVAFIQSFWFPFYHHFSRVRAWKMAMFALWIILVGMLVFNVYFILQLNKRLPVFLASLPAVTFANGQMTAPSQRVSVQIPQTPYQIVLDPHAAASPSYQTFFDEKIMVFISKNHIYMPAVSSVQSQPIPTDWNLTLTPSWLQEKQDEIASVLQTIFFVASFFVLISFFLGSFCMAGAVLFLWQGLSRKPVPLPVRLRWAVILQGPALTLWIINLFVSVPLFLFAIFILFMMYSQQIYNTLPEEKRG